MGVLCCGTAHSYLSFCSLSLLEPQRAFPSRSAETWGAAERQGRERCCTSALAPSLLFLLYKPRHRRGLKVPVRLWVKSPVLPQISAPVSGNERQGQNCCMPPPAFCSWGCAEVLSLKCIAGDTEAKPSASKCILLLPCPVLFCPLFSSPRLFSPLRVQAVCRQMAGPRENGADISRERAAVLPLQAVKARVEKVPFCCHAGT